ncbi:hypothetical protein OOC_17977 [Providencia rettgeri Dmel1]|nr:hypothetical protein OOC_17977 [Providencia rettgeri Dmel1]
MKPIPLEQLILKSNNQSVSYSSIASIQMGIYFLTKLSTSKSTNSPRWSVSIALAHTAPFPSHYR